MRMSKLYSGNAELVDRIMQHGGGARPVLLCHSRELWSGPMSTSYVEGNVNEMRGNVNELASGNEFRVPPRTVPTWRHTHHNATPRSSASP